MTTLTMPTPISAAPPMEVLKSGRVKGAMVKAHLQWLRESTTADQQRHLFASITPTAAMELSGPILASSWYSFSSLIALDRAIVELFAFRDEGVLEELGAYSARLGLTTVYRAFGRGSAHEFFRQSALLHQQYQDFGSATYEQLSEQSGRMIHRHYRCFSTLYCRSALGYYRTILTLHGATRPAVEETRCHCLGDDSCTFELRW